MESWLYNSWVYVDISALRANVREILRELPQGVKLIPVLKCNAYGLGLLPVARVLGEFPEIETFAVAQVWEGIRLREAGFSQEILVFGGTVPQHFGAAVQWDLTLTAGRTGLASSLAEAAKAAGKPVRVHIKVETGLNRVGILPGEELADFIEELRAVAPWVTVSGTYSHFADAESENLPRTEGQRAAFEAGLAQLRAAGIDPGCRHLSNSAASEWYPQGNFDAVRMGRRLYMDSQTNPAGRIREVASFRTVVTNLRHLPAGASLGYGKGYVLPRDMVVATIGAGYGDGVHRQVANGGPALVQGQRAKLLTCCMDQSFLDVTDIGCAVGDSVTLFGYDEMGNFLPSQEVAKLADDEGCGLTAALSDRVARVYSEEV